MSNSTVELHTIVETFGQHKVKGFWGGHNQKVLDLVEPELHEDGTYTLHVNASLYVKTLRDQWWNTPKGVMDFYDDGSFLYLNHWSEAEEAAAAMAHDANKNIQHHVIDAPAMPIGEVVDEEYEDLYGEIAPEFVVKFYDTVDAVQIEDLMDYWFENQDEEGVW